MRVLYGNLLTLPVGVTDDTSDGGLLYVQPLYAVRGGTSTANYPVLQYVLVSLGSKSGIGDTVAEAVADVLGTTLDETPPSTNPDGPTPPGTNPPDNGQPASVVQLLRRADAQFKVAQQALEDGDLVKYAEATKRAEQLVQRALAAAELPGGAGQRRRLTRAGDQRPDLAAPRTAGNVLFTDAGWSSSVARWAHNPEVAGSNPAPATKQNRRSEAVFRITGRRLLALLGGVDYLSDYLGAWIRSPRAVRRTTAHPEPSNGFEEIKTMAARMTKRPDGRYQVKVTTPESPRLVYGKTQADARSKAEEVKERIKAGASVRDASRSLAEWLTEWVETYLKVSDRAQSTKIMYAGYCRHWLVPTLGTVPLGKVTPGDVTRLMLAMQEAGKSESTIRKAEPPANWTSSGARFCEGFPRGLCRHDTILSHGVLAPPRCNDLQLRDASAHRLCECVLGSPGGAP